MVAFHADLERRFEQALIDSVTLDDALLDDDVGAVLRAIAGQEGPSVSNYIRRWATAEQVLEFLVHLSPFPLEEADAELFARSMSTVGLDSRHGAHLEATPGVRLRQRT